MQDALVALPTVQKKTCALLSKYVKVDKTDRQNNMANIYHMAGTLVL